MNSGTITEGPTHQRLVESALSLNAEIGVEDLSKLPPLERQAAALHWYAYEIRRNGLTNLRGLDLLTLEIRSALAWVNSDAARSTAALLSSLEEIEERDVEGTESTLSDMLDQLLVDAEEYFSRQLGGQKAGANKRWKIASAFAVGFLAALGDGVFAWCFLIAYLTREADGGAWLTHMQKVLPLAVLGNFIYAILWLPSSKAGKWIARHWFPLALAGLGLHLVVILSIFAAAGETEMFYLNLRFFALGVGSVLGFRYMTGGMRSLYFIILTLPEQRQMLRALLLQPHRGITDQMRQNFALALERRAERRKSDTLARLAVEYRDWLARGGSGRWMA